MTERRWLRRSIEIFIVLFLLWGLTILVLDAASAGEHKYLLGLKSELRADYALGEVGSLGAFRISIVNDIFRDRGYSAEEAEHQAEVYRVALSSPVPTATARNLTGDPPLTATSTITSTPTETPTNTVPPTATRTKTQKPTKVATAAVKKPTNTKTPKKKASKTPTPLPTPPTGYAVSVTRKKGVDDASDSLDKPDNDHADVGTESGAKLILDFGGWTEATAGKKLAVYENYVDKSGCKGGILQDQVVVSIGTDVNFDTVIEWTVVYIFGDGPSEKPNTCILKKDLYDKSAYLINVSGKVSSPFRWVRFQNYPVGEKKDSGEQVQVDAVKIVN
jgi:hypothetical protein